MIPNLVGSQWRLPSDGIESLAVYNPATGQVIDQVPLSGSNEVDAAVQAAVMAYATWSLTPVMERVRLMFRFKSLLEEQFEDLAAIITRHHGKTLAFQLPGDDPALDVPSRGRGRQHLCAQAV